jgi:hypothetical protein
MRQSFWVPQPCFDPMWSWINNLLLNYLLCAFARDTCQHFLVFLIAMMLKNRDSSPLHPNLLLLQPLPRLPIILLTPTCACKLPYDSIGFPWLVIILFVVYACDFTRVLACEFVPVIILLICARDFTRLLACEFAPIIILLVCARDFSFHLLVNKYANFEKPLLNFMNPSL